MFLFWTDSSPACILHEAQVSQLRITQLTAEAPWVPVVVHGLDDTADDELTWRRESLLTCTGHQPPHLALQVSLGMSPRDPQRVGTGCLQGPGAGAQRMVARKSPRPLATQFSLSKEAKLY